MGEVSLALLAAASALATPEKAPTLRELAMHARVGYAAARASVQNLTRSGALMVVRTRRVPYRSRPVAEYVIAPPSRPAESAAAVLLSAWHQPLKS